MALLVCVECGGRVASTASACPHCGNPVSNLAEREGSAPMAVAVAKPETGPFRLSRPQAFVLSLLVSAAICWVILVALQTMQAEVYQVCNAASCRFENRSLHVPVRACAALQWSFERSSDVLRTSRACVDEIAPGESVSASVVAPPDLLARCISDGPCHPELVDSEIDLPPLRKNFFFGFWILSVVGVFVDARRNRTAGGTPLGHALGVVVVWPVGLPMYLYRRLGGSRENEAPALPEKPKKSFTQSTWFSALVILLLLAIAAALVVFLVDRAESRRISEGQQVMRERQASAEPTPSRQEPPTPRMEWPQVFHVAGHTTQTTEMFTLIGGGETRIRWRAQAPNGAMNFSFTVRGRDGSMHLGPNVLSSDAGETRIHGANGEHFLDIHAFNAHYEIWVEQMRPALAMPAAPPPVPSPAPAPTSAGTPRQAPAELDPVSFARQEPTLVHPRATLLYSSDPTATPQASFTWRSGNASIVLEARMGPSGPALYRQSASAPIATWTSGPGLRTEITLNELSDGTALARLEDVAGNRSFGHALVLHLDHDERADAITVVERWEGTSSAYWHDQAPSWTAMRRRRALAAE